MSASGNSSSSSLSVLFRLDEDARSIPAAVAAKLEAIRVAEREETQRSQKALDAAWVEVERIVALNKERDALLAQLATTLPEYDSHNFWSEGVLGDHFKLTPAIPSDTTDDAKDEESAVPNITGATRAADMAKFAPAAERMAPIRRCFANLLSKRATAPKECTILMKGLDELQKRVVPIEESLFKCRFKLPLHAPFQSVSKLITRTLIPVKTGAKLEDEAAASMTAQIKELEAEYLRLESTKDPKEVYAFLEKEALARKKFHDSMLMLIDEAVKVERDIRKSFAEAHSAAAQASNDSLDSISTLATNVTESSKALVEEVVALEAKGVSTADSELQELQRRLKDAQYRLQRGRRNQESQTRQVRELLKSIAKEQAVNDETANQVAALTCDIARLQAAKKQFVGSCADRRALLVDAHQACEYVNEVIAQVTKEVNTALDLCRQHESRVVSEETYRKLRIARQPMKNAQEWYRCVGDLLRIRVHRRDDIRQRMAGSWQLEFLLSQEEQAQCAVIAQYEAELQQIQTQWAKLTTTLVDLEMHVPVLHQYDRDSTVTRMRNAFLAIEGIGKDKDMKDAHRELLFLESAAEVAASGGDVLPPVPPPRSRKSRKDPATGVRPLPRPPSGGIRGGGASTPTPAAPPRSARPPSAKRGVTLPAIGSAVSSSPPPQPQTARQ